MFRRLSSRLLALALVPAAGCSLFLVKGPPDHHELLEHFDCTTTTGAPAADLALGAAWATWLILGLTDLNKTAAKTPGLVIGLPILAVPVGSAMIGFRKVNQCRDAKSALSERVAAEARERVLARPDPPSSSDAPAGENAGPTTTDGGSGRD